MNAMEFHAGLRALRNIDRHDLVQAGVIPQGLNGDKDWQDFRANPHHFAIQIGDVSYARLFELVKERMKGREDTPGVKAAAIALHGLLGMSASLEECKALARSAISAADKAEGRDHPGL